MRELDSLYFADHNVEFLQEIFRKIMLRSDAAHLHCELRDIAGVIYSANQASKLIKSALETLRDIRALDNGGSI